MNHLLYETDFVLWTEQQAERLLARQDLPGVDWKNLAEEILALGRSEKRELEHRLEVLFEHLIKRCYIENSNDYRGWELTIKEQRKQLRRLVRDSPSLKTHFERVMPEVWRDACSDLQDDYPTIYLPEDCPFPNELDQLLTTCFWQAM